MIIYVINNCYNVINEIFKVKKLKYDSYNINLKYLNHSLKLTQ